MIPSKSLKIMASRMLGSKIALRSDYGPFIGGAKFIKGEGTPLPVESPSTCSNITTVSTPSSAQIASTLDLAQLTFDSGVWSRSSALSRSKVLAKLAVLLEEKVPELAEMESLNTGRAVRELKAQLGRLPDWLSYFAAVLRTTEGTVMPTEGEILNYVKRQPLGVVVQIAPFNHPLLIAVKKIAPALAAGNSVIVKPSELTPLTLLEFGLLATKAGIPDGVLCILPGEGRTVGKELVVDRRVKKIDLTGGTETGRVIGAIAGGNLASYTAELGGKAPIIVFEDSDLQNAVNGVCFASFVASGQTCVSGTRIIVQDSIYDEFMAKLKEKVASIERRMGDPLNPLSSMGPLISRPQLSKSEGIVASSLAEGLTVECGGKRMNGPSPLDGFDLGGGYFFQPTVLSGDGVVGSKVWKEEIFGPVICVSKFSDEADAIKKANDCDFGLGAAIWTSNGARGHRVAGLLDSGLVWINSHHRNDPSSPWGGMKDSGIGRENGMEAYRSYTQSKSVIMNVASEEKTRANDDWFSDSKLDVRYG
ncbi:aldehyde dehydrogenase [Mrakia frigida]|uniref:aldehyde dehydrogenase n=1 Tax=Mrakia frigida TaxID=29902 RepID=UPI003FCC162C